MSLPASPSRDTKCRKYSPDHPPSHIHLHWSQSEQAPIVIFRGWVQSKGRTFKTGCSPIRLAKQHNCVSCSSQGLCSLSQLRTCLTNPHCAGFPFLQVPRTDNTQTCVFQKFTLETRKHSFEHKRISRSAGVRPLGKEVRSCLWVGPTSALERKHKPISIKALVSTRTRILRTFDNQLCFEELFRTWTTLHSARAGD